MNNYITAIKLLSPDAIVAGVGRTLDTLVFQHNPDNLTHEQIQEKMDQLCAAEPMRLLRIERNQLLAQSDWRATVDYPGADKQAWLDYRQALRDLPATQDPQFDDDGNLTNITWPEVPNA